MSGAVMTSVAAHVDDGEQDVRPVAQRVAVARPGIGCASGRGGEAGAGTEAEHRQRDHVADAVRGDEHA